MSCSTARKITLIWVAMDGFFVLFYVSASLLRGRTPCLSDLQNGLLIAQDFPSVISALVWVNFVAHLSNCPQLLAACMGWSVWLVRGNAAVTVSTHSSTFGVGSVVGAAADILHKCLAVVVPVLGIRGPERDESKVVAEYGQGIFSGRESLNRSKNQCGLSMAPFAAQS